jgi:sugar phosphate isomerase/epimerase
LEVSDIFCVPWTDFTTMAPNHPEASERARGRDLFRDMLSLARALDAPGITMIPGVDWPQETHEQSLLRAAEELEARSVEARHLGLGFSIEPHVGSVCHDPGDVLALCALAPSLELTLDYTHFVAQGVPERDIEPLAAYARHVQARGVNADQLQAPLARNTLDFERMIDVLQDAGFDGYINVEYVWVDWMRLNEVDVLSETVLLRDRLRAKLTGEAWHPPGPTGITGQSR